MSLAVRSGLLVLLVSSAPALGSALARCESTAFAEDTWTPSVRAWPPQTAAVGSLARVSISATESLPTTCEEYDSTCNGPETICRTPQRNIDVVVSAASCGEGCEIVRSEKTEHGVAISVRASRAGTFLLRATLSRASGGTLQAEQEVVFEDPRSIAVTRNTVESPHGATYAMLPGAHARWCAKLVGTAGFLTFDQELLGVSVEGLDRREGSTAGAPEPLLERCTTFAAREPGEGRIAVRYGALERGESVRVVAMEDVVSAELVEVSERAWVDVREDALADARTIRALEVDSCSGWGASSLRRMTVRATTSDGTRALAPAQALSFAPADLAVWQPAAEGSPVARLDPEATGNGDVRGAIGAATIDVPLDVTGNCHEPSRGEADAGGGDAGDDGGADGGADGGEGDGAAP